MTGNARAEEIAAYAWVHPDDDRRCTFRFYWMRSAIARWGDNSTSSEVFPDALEEWMPHFALG